MSVQPDIREKVREKYGSLVGGEARAESQPAAAGCGCGCGAGETFSACCGGTASDVEALVQLGYEVSQAEAVPEGSNLGLGCGNPIAHAELRPGETVLDLGSGAGIDVFLAAREVGPTGLAIGVDMTTPMLERARANASKVRAANVEFRLGEIEHLPVADGTVDVVISNCVINLSPDKPGVFREAYRALRPGGRLVVSDIVLTHPLPQAVKESVDAYVGCVAGASLRDDYLRLIREAGFERIEVRAEDRYAAGAASLPESDDWRRAYEAVVSLKVRAFKPRAEA